MKIHPTAYVCQEAELAPDVQIGPFAVIHGNVRIGAETRIGAHCILGESGSEISPNDEALKTTIGRNSLIRSGAIIYAGADIGESFECGHRVTIRERSNIAEHVRIGTLSDIQGDCWIGSYSRLHSNVHVGKRTRIEPYVWIFPYVVLTNDPHPPSDQLLGVTIKRFAVIATSSVILPGVEIGTEAVVGAMSLVKENIPDGMLAIGNPASVVCRASRIRNRFDPNSKVYPWKDNFQRGMPWDGIGYERWVDAQSLKSNG